MMDLISQLVAIVIGASLLLCILCLVVAGPEGRRRSALCLALVLLVGVVYMVATR